MAHFWQISSCFFLMLQLFACGGKSVRPQTPATIELEAIEPYLEKLRSRSEQISSVVARLKLSVDSPKGNQKVSAILWCKKHNKSDRFLMNLQVMGMLNEPRLLLIANDKQFVLYSVEEQNSIVLPLQDEILSELLGLNFRLSELQDLIIATPPVDTKNTEFILKNGSEYFLQLDGSDSEQIEKITIVISEDFGVTVKSWILLNSNGTIERKIEFSDYRNIDGIPRPMKATIERPNDKLKVALKFSKLQLNTKISMQKFNIDRFIKTDK